MQRFKSLAVAFVLLSVGLIPLAQKSYAQNDQDALRYSLLYHGGTTRNMSMGGAFGALGGDMSTLSNNPAGIAIYRKSEFSFTPGLQTNKTKSSYLGSENEDSKVNLNVNSLGVVLSYTPPASKAEGILKGWNFGIAYNKLNNYNSKTIYEAKNPKNSLLNYYAQQAYGNNPSELENLFPFDVNLAYYGFLIDTNYNMFGDSSTYLSAIPAGGELQRRTVETSGRMGEMAFSFGGNFDHKLYLGATVGFTSLVYNEEVTYEEIDVDNTIIYEDSTYDFKSFKLNQDLNTVGSGINFKFGAIYKPAEWVRLGAAIHSPTYFYEMHDDYSTSIRSVLQGYDETFQSPQGAFDYQVTTPFRAMGSIAFIIMEYGLVSMDYEIVDYSMAKLNSTNYKFRNENEVIKNKYTQAANLRFGTEWKYGPLSVRGGYALYGSPFAKDVATSETDLSTDMISFGLGYRQEGYFVDLGYAQAKRGEFYRPYKLQDQIVDGATYKSAATNIQLTLGARF